MWVKKSPEELDQANTKAEKRRPFEILVQIILGIIAQVDFWNVKEDVISICTNCGRTTLDNKITTCSCGGRFEDIKTMKWVEDKSS